MLASMLGRRLVRIVAAAVAVAACAWFAVGVRQAHDSDLATTLINSPAPLGAARADRAASLLHAAQQLNPDHAVDLLRVQLALREGDRERARAIALSVTRAEPQNLQAWLAYGSASSNDPRAFRLALRRLNQLAPAVRRAG
jgi:hypothetical protein